MRVCCKRTCICYSIYWKGPGQALKDPLVQIGLHVLGACTSFLGISGLSVIQKWLTAWAYKHERPKYRHRLDDWSRRAVKAIKEVHGETYTYDSAAFAQYLYGERKNLSQASKFDLGFIDTF